MVAYILLAITVFVVLVLSYFLVKKMSRVSFLEKKYSAIIDMDAEVEKSSAEKKKIASDIDALRSSYSEKRAVYDRLVREAAIYDEEIKLAEMGFYKPHFDFDSSEKFKQEISKVKDEQKGMVSAKTAVTCDMEWSVSGSKSKGKTMTNRGIKLTARAFNNECDSAIANTRWNNVDRMEQRIEKAYESINSLNQSNAIVISHGYYLLKLKELRLTYEYHNKKQQEKEEQQEIRQQMREEARLEQEMEKALKDEEKCKKLLDKAKKDAEGASESKLASLNEKIELLNKQLEEAHEKSERAKSMAEQTRTGHVYVISNIGSFGESVYKIGMTRRLEPLDRVKELGDASVPFEFDVHAMIHSEDAPALESALHNTFGDHRLNLVNTRKEFFKVNLDKIQDEVKKISPSAEFIVTAEARAYRESQVILSQRLESDAAPAKDILYPDSI